MQSATWCSLPPPHKRQQPALVQAWPLAREHHQTFDRICIYIYITPIHIVWVGSAEWDCVGTQQNLSIGHLWTTLLLFCERAAYELLPHTHTHTHRMIQFHTTELNCNSKFILVSCLVVEINSRIQYLARFKGVSRAGVNSRLEILPSNTWQTESKPDEFSNT